MNNVISITIIAGLALGNITKNWRHIQSDIEIFWSKLY